MSSLSCTPWNQEKEKAVERTKPIPMHWQQLDDLKVSAKPCSYMLRTQAIEYSTAALGAATTLFELQ